jgi:hypothetical protein
VAVEGDFPDWVDLELAVLGVDHPRADETKVVADVGAREVAAVAGHELDDEVAVLLGVVTEFLRDV